MINEFTSGLRELAALQAKLGRPPKSKEVPVLVTQLVKGAGLKGDSRERYFRLLATCALKNQEQNFRNWKPIRRRK